MNDLRERMIAYRTQRRLSRYRMAERCKCSERLIFILEEEAGVTAPNIAKRVAKEYGLTELEAEELMPINRRPNGGDYDPDRYLHEIRTIYDKELKEVPDNDDD